MQKFTNNMKKLLKKNIKKLKRTLYEPVSAYYEGLLKKYKHNNKVHICNFSFFEFKYGYNYYS